MKHIIALLTLISLNAFADPLPNINGMSGRLENISCRGGYFTTLARATSIYQMAEKECAGDLKPEAMDACFEAVIKKNTAPRAVMFRGAAIPDKKTMQMTIKTMTGSQTLFSSIREGFHGDGNEGQIMLMFSRVGMPGDPYMIETGRLTHGGTRVPQIIVPVKQRIIADQVYFFFNCELRWIQ